MGDNLKTSVVFIGTGRYINFLPDYYNATKSHFLNESEIRFHVFTDHDQFANWPSDMNVYKINHLPWPFVTLLRFKFMNQAMNEIAASENCVFIDADLIFQSKVSEVDLFNGKKHFGVQHPGFVFEPSKATFDRNPLSAACVSDKDDLGTYWQGCLWGAKSEEFSKMVQKLDDAVDADLRNRVVAIWHDESHLNRYLIDVKNDVNTLHPGYATPERWENIKHHFPTVALHLHKSMEEFPRFEGVR
jgi:hypothetical protein